MNAFMAEVREFIAPIVKDVKAQQDLDGAKDEETLLVCTRFTDKFYIQELRCRYEDDETLNILLAGRDTVCLCLYFEGVCAIMFLVYGVTVIIFYLLPGYVPSGVTPSQAGDRGNRGRISCSKVCKKSILL